jgi:hypothetical protein
LVRADLERAAINCVTNEKEIMETPKSKEF